MVKMLYFVSYNCFPCMYTEPEIDQTEKPMSSAGLPSTEGKNTEIALTLVLSAYNSKQLQHNYYKHQ